jgi:hypothetical protein
MLLSQTQNQPERVRKKFGRPCMNGMNVPCRFAARENEVVKRVGPNATILPVRAQGTCGGESGTAAASALTRRQPKPIDGSNKNAATQRLPSRTNPMISSNGRSLASPACSRPQKVTNGRTRKEGEKVRYTVQNRARLAGPDRKLASGGMRFEAMTGHRRTCPASRVPWRPQRSFPMASG